MSAGNQTTKGAVALEGGPGRSGIGKRCPQLARVSLFSGQSGVGGLLSTLSTHPWVGIPLSHSSGGGQGAALPGDLSQSYFAKATRVVGEREEVPNTDQSAQRNLKEQSRDSMVLELYYRNSGKERR